ncbi:MAG: hypothetical protein IPI68_08320 [Chitinophagaceae bacterium]|nr:hypothetical protein [Chitinophagaceae bacterium]
MEVHAHSHTPRKKWTHYFWEFLMLFLAVFCGFLAEYQLEHKIEKDRGKQYVHSMFNDLKKDTASLNAAIQGNQILLTGLDSLLGWLANHGNEEDYKKKIYLYSVKYTYYFMIMEFSEITLSQLKNSGGFRLISDKEVASGILQYAQGMDVCKKYYSDHFSYFHVHEATQKELFDLSYAKKIYEEIEKNYLNMLMPDSQMMQLIKEGDWIYNDDIKLIKRYYNDVLFYKTSLNQTNNSLIKQKESADSLMQLIVARYHIKNR